ncbi:MAG: glycoside hydrolase [Candidatus Eremiobacteraeota bacterium]|nr:glycoside hydrolase [Candidatus Eremiobacteraeota bacterium]
MSWRAAIALGAVAFAAGCGGGGGSGSAAPPMGPTASPPIVLSQSMRISSDPFTNASSQHATEVEPSAFSFGSTIVAASQAGRFRTSGSSDIVWEVSRDAGSTWASGVMPGMTQYTLPAAPFDSVSDPVVAYDAAHATWLVSSIPVYFNNAPQPPVLVNRSTDGLTWTTPVPIVPYEVEPDKDWMTCDNSVSSPYYGHCYVEWDEFGNNLTIHMSVSTDGGQSWSPPRNTAGNAAGLGGQPLVQPNGTVVVPIDDGNESNILSFVSTDGGATWTQPVNVTRISDHADAGGIRSGPLPSAAIDASGRIFLAWQDCRFRTGCTSNDIVLSTSADGLNWSTPARVPIDANPSSADHFLPGIGVDASTAGGGAHLGITYYYYPDANCTVQTCQLFSGFIASQDGGNTWGLPVSLAGPMALASLAQTTQGAMVGDYIATVFSNARPVGVFPVASVTGGGFDEALNVPRPGTIHVSSVHRSSAGERAEAAARSDHPPRHPRPIR